MAHYNFKDKYTDFSGNYVNNATSVKFYSALATGGNGNRLTPYRSNNLQGFSGVNTIAILSSGVHVGLPAQSTTELAASTVTLYRKQVIGDGINSTVFSYNWRAHLWGSSGGQGASVAWAFKDLTIDNMTFSQSNSETYGTYYMDFRNVRILNPIISSITATLGIKTTVARCVLKTLSIPSAVFQNNNSFIAISTTIGAIAGNLHTFEKCNLIVTQASLDSYKNNYYAFDNCNFRIGTETEYAPLIGTTAEDLRTDFVNRCTAAGLTVPADITDFGITLTLGRWLFTKNQIFEGVTWKGSEINLFEVPRLISFGYTSTADRIAVTTQPNVPGTFSPSFSNTGQLDFQDGGLYIPNTDDVTDLHYYSAASNIVSFGQKKQLTRLMLVGNMPAIYGVKADTTADLQTSNPIYPGTALSAGIFYIVRSDDKQPATISYNGATYSTSLNTRNNLVLGVAGAAGFTATSGNPVLYRVLDELQYNTLQVRVVNKIPPDIIKTGALLRTYWYIVEHDTDQNNTTDYVTYNGVDYYVGSSFLIMPDTTDFTITGNVHLRRCWNNNFDFATETVDKDFWTYQQKPEWCEVVDADPRCLLRNNHDLAHEMERGADGKYIASGHPDFYNLILGEGAVLMKPMPIKGAYMQVRVVISTLNIM